MEAAKEKALTILECMDTLNTEQLRQCDAVYGSKRLLELCEDLSVRIGIIWDEVYNLDK